MIRRRSIMRLLGFPAVPAVPAVQRVLEALEVKNRYYIDIMRRMKHGL